jgi:hypothetical protein
MGGGAQNHFKTLPLPQKTPRWTWKIDLQINEEGQ